MLKHPHKWALVFHLFLLLPIRTHFLWINCSLSKKKLTKEAPDIGHYEP